MKTKYHIEITLNALKGRFSSHALDDIVHANIKHNRIKNQFGHDYIHFDGSAFAQGFSYIDEQKEIILNSIDKTNFMQARSALGRLCHSWQDFYSHSNYVKLWLEKCNAQNPKEVDPDDQQIMQHPDLKSGKNYGIIEFIAMLPILSSLITSRMPADSHARMNLDSPKAGDLFQFAYWASLKRTQIECDRLIDKLQALQIDPVRIQSFKGF